MSSMRDAEWLRFEKGVNALLGLDATAASGATWKDKGDGSTRNNYEEPWPLLVDAKTTEKGSYSLTRKFLEDMRKVAVQDGKTFALPLRFITDPAGVDWIVCPLADYAYLIEEERKRPREFTVEEVALIRSIQKTVKTPVIVDMLAGILAKMGVDS